MSKGLLNIEISKFICAISFILLMKAILAITKFVYAVSLTQQDQVLCPCDPVCG